MVAHDDDVGRLAQARRIKRRQQPADPGIDGFKGLPRFGRKRSKPMFLMIGVKEVQQQQIGLVALQQPGGIGLRHPVELFAAIDRVESGNVETPGGRGKLIDQPRRRAPGDGTGHVGNAERQIFGDQPIDICTIACRPGDDRGGLAGLAKGAPHGLGLDGGRVKIPVVGSRLEIVGNAMTRRIDPGHHRGVRRIGDTRKHPDHALRRHPAIDERLEIGQLHASARRIEIDVGPEAVDRDEDRALMRRRPVLRGRRRCQHGDGKHQ